MARAIWTGSLSFGLVNVPVGLYSATADRTIHFNQFQAGTADRVRNKRVNERTGEEVTYQDIVKGFDLGAGEYVIVAPDELAALAPAAIVAAHVHPELRWGSVAIDPGAINASCAAVEITGEGEPSHGAYPHLGRDPILAIAQIVVALHAQVARRIDPHAPAVLTVGVLEGGSAENVIPARARARAALRAHRPEDRVELRRLVEEVVAGVAAAHGVSARVELVVGEPALENDPGIVARARELLASAGLAQAGEWRSCGSDDFAVFGARAPIAMAFVGLDGAPGFTRRPLHHPELLVGDEAVAAVARVQAVLYLAASAAR